MPSNNRFNTVVIVDSIPDGQMNTARRLWDDLRDISNEFSPVPRIEYARVESADDFARAITTVCVRVRTEGIHPLVHLEAHGDEHGLELALGARVDWTHVKETLTPLNIAMELNLLLVLAACHGGTFIESIRLADRAPVWGLIGPTNQLSVARVQADFAAFYKTMFKTLSPSKAIEALNSNAPTGLYFRTTAEGLFYKAWRLYKDTHCTDEQLQVRAKRMYRRAKDEGMDPLPSVGHLKRRLLSTEPASFNKFRDKYFMYDLFPEHAARFAVTYQSAGTRSAR